jgi:GxxExxY protein
MEVASRQQMSSQLPRCGGREKRMNRQGARDARNARICEPPRQADDLARAILAAAVEVHRTLGPGFLESVYEESLALELSERGVPFRRQPCIIVAYKGKVVGQARLDFLVGELVLVELKSVETLLPIHRAQVISYLRGTKLSLGLLVNFNVPILLRGGVRRLVLTHPNPGAPGDPGGPGAFSL